MRRVQVPAAAACPPPLNSRGLLDYDEKVNTYWPEFGQNGKEDVTVNQLLQHRAGLSAIDRKLIPEIITDHEKLAKALPAIEFSAFLLIEIPSSKPVIFKIKF